MIKTLVLVRNASSYDFDDLLTTYQGSSFWKSRKHRTHEASRWRVSETPILWKSKDEGLFEPWRFHWKPQVRLIIDAFYGIRISSSQAKTIRRRKEQKVCPYLLKIISITVPYQVLCSDITYIRQVHGFEYLTAIMGL